MASTTRTTLDPVLKQVYDPNLYRSSTYEDRPFFALIEKDEQMLGGRNTPVISKYGNPQGVSASLSTAQSNASAIKYEDFVIQAIEYFGVSTIDGLAIKSAEKDRDAFVNAQVAKIDTTMESVLDAIESYIPRSGSGSIGQVSSGSTVSAKTITLEDIAEAHNFEPGMVVRGTSTDGGAYDTGSETLYGVNRATGVLTATSAAWNTVMSALAASDYLVRSGDALNGGTAPAGNAVITGLAGWLPTTVATSDSFFGVNRSVDTRLWGNYYDGSALSVEEALINGQSFACQVGGKVNLCFVNHTKFRRLKSEIGTKEWFGKAAKDQNKEPVADINFWGIRIMGDRGPIDVIPANKCQGTTAWLLQEDTVVLGSIGAVPQILDEDGLTLLRQSSANGYEVRVGGYMQFAVKVPGYNARVVLPS